VSDTENQRSPESGDRIIEVGIAILSGGRIVDRYQSFINP